MISARICYIHVSPSTNHSGWERAYASLEAGNLFIGKGIRLGDDGNQVDLVVKATHNLNVERLQRVASRLNEEDAGMNAVVHDVHAVDLILRVEVSIVTLLNVVDNGPPRLIVVHEIAEAGSVDDGQAETDTGFLDVGADGLDRDGLGYYVKARPLPVLGRIQGSVEESVDKRRFTKTGFTWNILIQPHDI